MLKEITKKLSKAPLSGWQVRSERKKSLQSFLAKEKRECARVVDTESFVVSIYQKRIAPVLFDASHGNGYTKPAPSPNLQEVLGLSSFKIVPQNFPEFDRLLEESLLAAGFTTNQPFELPDQPKRLQNIQISDPSLAEKSLVACEDALRRAVSKQKKIRLSSAEFFVDRIDSRLVNHKGLDVEQTETVLHTEFILLARSGRKENEYINRYSRRLLSDFDLDGEVKQSARFASDATKASLPKTGSFPVLLSGEPLDQLFNPIMARASARLRYNKMMDISIGQSVTAEGETRGDKVTLWSNSLLKGALGSARFDSYGTPSQRTCLIENNILKQYLADKRYADYLNLPVTGELGNMEVDAGSKDFKNLENPAEWGGKTLYHLQAFSAFEPNPITGAFSAEIRSGYEISSKGTRPIKGGSVSGILHKDLRDAYFSKERAQRERFLGPRGVLFRNLTVAGN